MNKEEIKNFLYALHHSTYRNEQQIKNSKDCGCHVNDVGLLLTSSSCHPKIFVKEFSYFLMSCH